MINIVGILEKALPVFLLSSLLAMEGKCVTAEEGIVDHSVDKSIHNLTSIGANAMSWTDDMVLNIMTNKDS